MSKKTCLTDTHVTSVDVKSRWYEHDPFVFPAQVEQVFYVNDTKLGGNWRVGERFHHRGIWNVPEMDGLPDDALNNVFQQNETTEVIPIVNGNGMQVEGGGNQGVLCRDDIEGEIIPNTMVSQSHSQTQVEGVVDAFILMAPAKKMRRLPPPKRALLEPYSSSTDTCTPYPEGLAADGFEPIGPSLSQINVLSGSETIAPTPSQTNAPHGFEICEATLSETQAPSPQSQTSGAGASSSRRVRGPTVGKATATRVSNNNGNKLHIPITETFNAFEGVLATPGANEIGIQIRRMCPIQGVKSWTVADPATKGAVVQAVRGNLVQTSTILEYDMGGEGDLFNAPEPIIEDPTVGLDPMTAAISMISCGEDIISSQTLKAADIESIQNDQLLSEVFYECKKDILAKEAIETPLSDVLDIKIPVVGTNENLIAEDKLFLEGSFQKSGSSGCLSSMEWIPIRPNFLDFPGMDLGMRRAFSDSDIKSLGHLGDFILLTLGNGNVSLIHSPLGLPQSINNCTTEDRKQKLSRYRNKKTKRNFGRKIKICLLQVGCAWEPSVAAQIFGPSLERGVCRSSESCVAPGSGPESCSF
ncbi:unnamed protein product [Camellia sinensis]